MTTVAEAQQFILAHARSFGTESVPLAAALGRVLAQPVIADRDYPPFDRATMDGYAVQSADFQHNAEVSLRLLERIHAGDTGTQIVETGTCSKIMTGAPVPSGADAVVRVEDTQLEGDQVRFTMTSVRGGQNIARRGEDAHQNDLLLNDNLLITPQAASVLAVTGHADVVVARLPTVGIVSTGNEVIPLGAPVLPHQIRDSNAWALRGFFATCQITDVTATLAADDKAALRDTVAGLLEQKDIVVLSGGVSKGDADYVPEVLQSLGVRQVFHRVRIKPGGPLWFGVTAGGKAVFGLPGNPVSVQVAC
ncbi:MAG: molybdopterin molybdotransferase MoeA, partial [Cytophagales bacterium]|nr:molybdopterin molybdotransferase MoeA [Cytophagales bacterium]